MVYIAVLSYPNKPQAQKAAKAIVKNGLAACVNCISNTSSVFYWKGKIETCTETLLICKTEKRKLRSLERYVSEHHPYEVPEFVCFKANYVSESYKAWLKSSLNVNSK